MVKGVSAEDPHEALQRARKRTYPLYREFDEGTSSEPPRNAEEARAEQASKATGDASSRGGKRGRGDGDKVALPVRSKRAHREESVKEQARGGVEEDHEEGRVGASRPIEVEKAVEENSSSDDDDIVEQLRAQGILDDIPRRVSPEGAPSRTLSEHSSSSSSPGREGATSAGGGSDCVVEIESGSEDKGGFGRGGGAERDEVDSALGSGGEERDGGPEAVARRGAGKGPMVRERVGPSSPLIDLSTVLAQQTVNEINEFLGEDVPEE